MTSTRAAENVKQRFSQEDDLALELTVNELGSGEWKRVAIALGNRKARQCRERWSRYLAPSIRRDSWTPEEDIQLLMLQKQVGCRWPHIAGFFEGRSPVQLKNRWLVLDHKRRKEGLDVMQAIQRLRVGTGALAPTAQPTAVRIPFVPPPPPPPAALAAAAKAAPPGELHVTGRPQDVVAQPTNGLSLVAPYWLPSDEEFMKYCNELFI